MSIKIFCGIVLIHALKKAFENDPLGCIRNIFHGGQELYAIFFQRMLMNGCCIFVS